LNGVRFGPQTEHAKVPTSDVDGAAGDDDGVDIWNVGIFSTAFSLGEAIDMLLSVTESIFGLGGSDSVVVVTPVAW